MNRQIHSASGATLDAQLSGEGRPVVFVHGTASDADSWRQVTDRLDTGRRCLRYDRSGRGDSSDPAVHSLDTEVADLLAVMETAGPTVDVVAHSYGGLIALAAASRQPGSFRTLAVYEAPAHFPDAQFADAATVAELARTLAEQGPDAAIVHFMTNFPKVPPAAIEGMRASPGWAKRVGGAHTIPRELLVAEHFDADANIRLPLELPVLLFLGDASPPPFQVSHRHVSDRLPRARTFVLAGQGHRAMDVIPDAMATTLQDFFDA